MRRLRALALCVIGAPFVACAVVPEEAADYEVTAGYRPPAAPAPVPTPAPAAETPPPTSEPVPPTPASGPIVVKNYRGSVAASPKSAFGGDPYCNYEVTLRNIAVEIVVAQTGVVTAAAAHDTVVETADACRYKTMSPAYQEFSFKAAAKTATGTRVELTGSPDNPLKSSLFVDLVASATGYDATMTWQRTDQTGKLSWRVIAKAPITTK